MQAACLLAFKRRSQSARRAKLTAARLRDLAGDPFPYPASLRTARRWGSAATPVCHPYGPGQQRPTSSQSWSSAHSASHAKWHDSATLPFPPLLAAAAAPPHHGNAPVPPNERSKWCRALDRCWKNHRTPQLRWRPLEFAALSSAQLARNPVACAANRSLSPTSLAAFGAVYRRWMRSLYVSVLLVADAAVVSAGVTPTEPRNVAASIARSSSVVGSWWHFLQFAFWKKLPLPHLKYRSRRLREPFGLCVPTTMSPSFASWWCCR